MLGQVTVEDVQAMLTTIGIGEKDHPSPTLAAVLAIACHDNEGGTHTNDLFVAVHCDAQRAEIPVPHEVACRHTFRLFRDVLLHCHGHCDRGVRAKGDDV
jgi:hypothetical protein